MGFVDQIRKCIVAEIPDTVIVELCIGIRKEDICLFVVAERVSYRADLEPAFCIYDIGERTGIDHEKFFIPGYIQFRSKFRVGDGIHSCLGDELAAFGIVAQESSIVIDDEDLIISLLIRVKRRTQRIQATDSDLLLDMPGTAYDQNTRSVGNDPVPASAVKLNYKCS